MGVLVAVQEGHVGEEITALLRLVGLWGEEVLSYSVDGYSAKERESVHIGFWTGVQILFYNKCQTLEVT